MSGESHFIEFSKPFIDGVRNVFETMVATKIENLKPSLKVNNLTQGDISAVLGMSGEVMRNNVLKCYQAVLVVSFPFDTYFKIAGAMLCETYTKMCPEIQDLGAEIINMIVGNAKRDLKVAGYTSNMAIPSLIEGRLHTIKYPPTTRVIIIPFGSVHGEFYLEIGYFEDDKDTL